MRREHDVRPSTLWRGLTRTVGVLISACVLVTALTGQVLAIPNCWQINAEWCQVQYPYCPASIEWRPCGEDGQRQWRCVWGEPCNEVSQWQWCWCDGYGQPPGGCDCLLEGTPVMLADGSTKPVEAIQKGDRVLGYDERTAMMEPSEVISVHAPYLGDHYYVINETIRVTGPHPFLSGGKWLTAGELELGDILTAADGSATPIFSLRKIEEKVTVYNFQVAGGTYVAHGIVVHNKEDCEEYEVVPCPECR